jgi:hypothetical protein
MEMAGCGDQVGRDSEVSFTFHCHGFWEAIYLQTLVLVQTLKLNTKCRLVASRSSLNIKRYTTTSTSVPLIQISQPTSASTITQTIQSPPASLPVKAGSLPSTHTPTSHSGPKIVDFCETLENMSTNSDTLGFLEDRRWRHHVFRSSQCTELSSTKTLVSLRAILENSSRNVVSPREKWVISQDP